MTTLTIAGGRVVDVEGGTIRSGDIHVADGFVVDAFLDAVKDALERGEGIEIRGFGTFKVRHRKARTARKPRTGEPVEVSARAVPVFQPSRLLRDRVDRGKVSPEAGTCTEADGTA